MITKNTNLIRCFALIAIAASTAMFFTACKKENPGDPPGEVTGKNWFKINGTKYDVAEAKTRNVTDDEGAYVTIDLVTSAGIMAPPTLSVLFRGITLPTSGTFTPPSESFYVACVNGTDISSTYSSYPFSLETYKQIDIHEDESYCGWIENTFGGTVKITRTGDTYELVIDNIKLPSFDTYLDHAIFADHVLTNTVTVSAYYKGKLGAGNNVGDEDCSSIKLPQNFHMQYNAMMDFDMAKIGDNFYDMMDFYKKAGEKWDKYTIDYDYSSGNMVEYWKKGTTVNCAYTTSMIFSKSVEQTVTRNGSEMFLDINCRKYTASAGSTNVTYLVHPDYDIILRMQTNAMGMDIDFKATSFRTDITSWSEVLDLDPPQ